MNSTSRGGWKRPLIVATSVMALVSTLSLGSMPAQAAPRPKFDTAISVISSNSVDERAESVKPTARNAKRSRLAKLNDSVLPATVTPGSRIRFDLFPGLSLTGTFDAKEAVMDADTWSGTLEGNTGYFHAARAGDAVLLHVATSTGVFEVSKVGDATYRVIELDQAKNKEDAPGDLAIGQLPDQAQDPAADSGSILDVMVVYTQLSLSAEGSLSAMKARIALAVQETNTSYSKSGVVPRLRLVHIEKVNYTESGSFATDLNRLINPSDGYMDSVHSLRNAYRADMVGMIVEETSGICGLASAILATKATAFMMTARTCATGYYSFGHEFGHLQGARHDTYVDPAVTPYSYGHGYVNVNAGWRTIMAYNTACTDTGKNCTRLQYWSNPGVTYFSLPVGDSDTQNYRVLNNTASYVANFMTASIGSNFSSSFTSSTAGWSAVKGSWRLYNGTYQTYGLAGTGASAVHSRAYGDVSITARVRRVTTTDIYSANRIIIRGRSTTLTGTNSWTPSYSFQWTNEGSYSIWLMNSDGSSTPVVPWTATSALVTGSNYNVIRVDAVGGMLRMRINGTWVARVTNTKLRIGSVGVGVYRDSTMGTSSFFVDYYNLVNAPTLADTGNFGGTGDVAVGNRLVGGSANRAPQH